MPRERRAWALTVAALLACVQGPRASPDGAQPPVAAAGADYPDAIGVGDRFGDLVLPLTPRSRRGRWS